MDHERPARADPDEMAVAWFTRLRGNPTAAEREAFEKWLAATPANRAAWRRAAGLWSAAGAAGARVAEEEAPKLAAYLETIDRNKRRKVLRRAAGSLSAVLALVGATLWLESPNFFQDLTADYVAARGERRLVALPDTSTVLLDADSALDVDFAAGERRVKLLRGTAFFSVATTGAPFTVDAASGEVRVLGTEFDVRLDKGGAVVTLAQGKVEVEAGAHMASLIPGEQVRFSDRDIGPVSKADLDSVLAWREGRLIFNEARLADVVAEVARYRPGRVIITSDKLADWVVSGSLSLDDPEAALRSLQSSVGFSMRSVGGRLVILTQ
jgi:transmembrane sensor